MRRMLLCVVPHFRPTRTDCTTLWKSYNKRYATIKSITYLLEYPYLPVKLALTLWNTRPLMETGCTMTRNFWCTQTTKLVPVVDNFVWEINGPRYGRMDNLHAGNGMTSGAGKGQVSDPVMKILRQQSMEASSTENKWESSIVNVLIKVRKELWSHKC